MMKAFFTIFLFFLFSNPAFAYCDFEIIKMQGGIKKFLSQTDVIGNAENTPDAPISFRIPTEEVCKDSKFKMFPVHYTFIDRSLHQIFIEDRLTTINHLENLTYYYGKPNELFEDDGASGMKFYHWELTSKHVFLVIHFTPDETIQNIEIVSNKYSTLIDKYNEELEK